MCIRDRLVGDWVAEQSGLPAVCGPGVIDPAVHLVRPAGRAPVDGTALVAAVPPDAIWRTEFGTGRLAHEPLRAAECRVVLVHRGDRGQVRPDQRGDHLHRRYAVVHALTADAEDLSLIHISEP